MPTKKQGGGKVKKKKMSKLQKAKAAQGVTKIVVDKTFGMKNKNKSSKIKKFIQQQVNVQKQRAGLLKQGQTQSAADAEKRRLKKAKAKRDKELMALLGPQAAKAMQNAKKAKREEKKKKAEAIKAAEEENARQRAIDFAVPITDLDRARECESKREFDRIVAQYIKRDAMVTPQKDGSSFLYVQLTDGSTKFPLWYIIKSDYAKTWGNHFKLGQVLDIQHVTAIVRSDKGLARTVFLEEIVGKTIITKATKTLSEHILKTKKEKEEVRAKGGIPIEELIEEERSQMKSGGTPVTKDSFFNWLSIRNKRRLDCAKGNKANDKKGDSTKKKYLSGRELYNMNAELFLDDENAATEKFKGKTLSDDENDETDHSGGPEFKKKNDTDDKSLPTELQSINVDVGLFSG